MSINSQANEDIELDSSVSPFGSINWADLISEQNLLFLKKRIAETNVNEAIDVCRIAWDQFPTLRESLDVKRMIESILKGLQERINTQVLAPISGTTLAMSATMERLDRLAVTNPALIEQGFVKTLEGLKAEMHNIRAAIHEPTAKIVELNQMVSELVFKPIAKGNAGEAALIDLWTEHFPKDQIEKVGGVGKEDIVVRPYLTDKGYSRFGDAISIERKTGRQKYSGSHRQEAIRHAKERGAAVALLLYDTQDNLPRSIQPVSISREQCLLVVITDLHSGSWRWTRETIEIIQNVIHASDSNVSAIDIDAIQQVVSELGNVVKFIDQVKGSNARIRSCTDDVEQHIASIKSLVKSYQDRLQKAITGASMKNQNLLV